MERVSKHTRYLANSFHEKLASLRHSNGRRVADIYRLLKPNFHSIVTFNLKDELGDIIGFSEVRSADSHCICIAAQSFNECNAVTHDTHFGVYVCCDCVCMRRLLSLGQVEEIAAAHKIQLRTGCFCNPGACAFWLGLTPADQLAAFKAGHHCGDNMDLYNVRCVILFKSWRGGVEANGVGL